MCLCTDVFLQVRLEWPTDLAINPLDNSLYILDNNIVLQVKELLFLGGRGWGGPSRRC